MTIGPDPIRQIEWMSSRRGTTHLLDELLDDRPRVVRAGPGLRVELHRTSVQVRIGEALDRAVVERLVRDAVAVARRNREAVVLARHDDASALLTRARNDRMVAAPVTERELVGVVAGGEREQLVAEADAEDRDAPDELTHRRRLLDERLRVARAVRQDDAVVKGERVGVDVVWDHGDRGTRSGEPAQDRALDPVVDDGDAGVAVAELVRVLGRDAGRERPAAHRWMLLHLFEGRRDP